MTYSLIVTQDGDVSVHRNFARSDLAHAQAVFNSFADDGKTVSALLVSTTGVLQRYERPNDATRRRGYYMVTLPWGKKTIASWDGRQWWLCGHPHEHETEYFKEIGPLIMKED